MQITSIVADISETSRFLWLRGQETIEEQSYTLRRAGKSGGARVIINVLVAKETVYLLTIYDKSDQETLSSKELDELLKYVPDDF